MRDEERYYIYQMKNGTIVALSTGVVYEYDELAKYDDWLWNDCFYKKKFVERELPYYYLSDLEDIEKELPDRKEWVVVNEGNYRS